MRIILRFLFKNIKENKFRSFLILFSVTISSALILASNAMTNSLNKTYMKQIRSSIGSAEIYISPNGKSSSPFVDPNKSKEFSDRLEYIIPVLKSRGTYKSISGDEVKLSINGYDYKDLTKVNPISLKESNNVEPFKGKKVIVSSNFAEKNKLKAGDNISIKINEANYKFNIAAIANDESLFYKESDTFSFLVPKDFMDTILQASNRGNVVYLKTKAGEDKQKLIDDLKKEYKNYDVMETMTEADLQRYTGMVSQSMQLMGIVVLLMSSFIIYTAFKVIVLERLPIIGTFRSIGATKKATDFILLAESLLYGVIGGGIGSVLGIGVLYLLCTMFMQGDFNIVLKPSDFVISFILAVILSLISSAIPIVRAMKYSLKDIILNDISKEGKSKLWKQVLGVVLIISSNILPRIADGSLLMIVGALSMLFSLVGIILIVPLFAKIISIFLGGILGKTFGNEGILAVKNLRENKSVLNNISILSLGISVILMINIISSSLAIEVSAVYTNTFKYDISVSGENLGDDFRRILEKEDGIKESYGTYAINNIEIQGKNDKVGCISGVQPNKYFDYYKFEFLENQSEVISHLDEERNIVIATALRDKYKYKINDTISLKFNNDTKEYRIIGFIDTMMYNGSFALISSKYLKEDGKIKNYNEILLKTSKNPIEIEKQLQKKFISKKLTVQSVDTMKENNRKSNEDLMNMLKVFAFMAMIIGSFGILNNFIISFIERRRSFAVLRSIGMSKGQNLKVLFIEALTGGVIGGVIGMLGGGILCSIIPYVIKGMIGVGFSIHYEGTTFVLAFVAGVLVSLFASMGPAFKSSKQDIIQAIKYE
ncbi:MAG: FtsX-like permease family protein [Clostridiaceae bacterium]